MNTYPRKTRFRKTRSRKVRSSKTMPSLFARVLALCLLAMCSNLALAQAVTPVASTVPSVPTEAQKIQMLIRNIEVMKDARFVRNGSDYDGAAAADHLRLKLRHAGDRIKTAQDFIAYLATGSSFSGKPYLIRFNDGHEVESATYFHTRLGKIERPAVAPSKPPPAPPAASHPVSIAAVPHRDAQMPRAQDALEPPHATSHALSESQKIQSLIHDLEATKGPRFVRDGHTYSVTQAVGYLRLQLRQAGKRIATAQDFIAICASRAPKTGQANRIRFANGREMDAGQYFRTRLAMIEHSATAIRPIPATATPTH